MSTPNSASGRKVPIPVVVSAKIVIAAALLALVLAKVNVSEAIQRLAHLSVYPLAVAALFSLLIPCILSLRWWILAKPVIGWGDALTYTWIGSFYALVLPGAVSGDLAKGGLLALKKTSTRQAALPASILVDRVIGLAVMLLFFALSSLLIWRSPPSPALERFALPAAGIGFALCGVLFLGLSTMVQRVVASAAGRLPWARVRGLAECLTEAVFAYSGKRAILGQALALSFLSQALSGAVYYALLRALGLHLGIPATFALYSIIAVLSLAPITFAGIGLRDWFAVTFFAAYRLPGDAGIAFAWLCLAAAVLQAFVGGFFQLGAFLHRERTGPEAPAPPDNRKIYEERWTDWLDMKVFGPSSRWLRSLLDVHLRTMSGDRPARVLDLGCGEGTTTSFLAVSLAGAEVTGIDRSEMGVRCAQARYRSPTLTFVRRENTSEIPEGSFALVTCLEVLEHVDDWQEMTQELSRLTSRYLIVSFPVGRMRPFEANIGHLRNFRRGEFEAYASSIGLRPLSVLYAGFPFYSPVFRELCNIFNSGGNSLTVGRYTWIQRRMSDIIFVLFRYLSMRHRGDQFCGLFIKDPPGRPAGAKG